MTTNTTNAENDFEFCAIENSGKINIQNLAYGDEEAKEHIYTVSTTGSTNDSTTGSTNGCTCPSDKYHEGACKHRIAVEDNEDVLATADPDPLAPVSRSDDCPDCDGTGRIGEWACFSCIESEVGQ